MAIGNQNGRSFFDDLSQVAAWPTARLSLARGLSSALVHVTLLAGGAPIFLQSIDQILIWPLFGGIAVMLSISLLEVVGMILAPIFGFWLQPVTRIGSFLFSSAIWCGDPLLYVVNRQFPAILNIADFEPINLQPLLIVRHPE